MRSAVEGGGGGATRSLSGVVGILGGFLANPQAYGPLGSTHFIPSHTGWSAVGRRPRRPLPQ